MASTDLFQERLSDCIWVKESRFQIWDAFVVVWTLIANATAKLKIMDRIRSKLTIRVIHKFLSQLGDTNRG